MSGGSFDYVYRRVIEFADKLDELIKGSQLLGEGYKWSPEVTARLQQILNLAEETAAYMKETEWLFSGDIGEETFLKNVNEIALTTEDKEVILDLKAGK